MNLLPCLARLAQLQHDSVDRLALQEAAEAAGATAGDAKAQLKIVARHLQLQAPRWLSAPDPAAMPALICAGAESARPGQWGLLRGRNSQDQWVSEWWDSEAGRWREQADAGLSGYSIALFKLRKPFSTSDSAVYQLIRQEMLAHRKPIGDAVLGGLMINIVALAASFYSMQIYDRVMPTLALRITDISGPDNIVAAIQRDAMRSAVASKREPEKVFAALNALIARNEQVPTAAKGIRDLPRSAWTALAPAPAANPLIAWAAMTPVVLLAAPFIRRLVEVLTVADLTRG